MRDGVAASLSPENLKITNLVHMYVVKVLFVTKIYEIRYKKMAY